VFQLVDQAVDFVMSKIDLSVGTREFSNQAPVQYELLRGAVSEAIVNAIAHRDYTSNGSVQVMLFKDRLEIWNPGSLPLGLSPEKLRQPHRSIPANPLLAEPMYLAGYIERMGTGTSDIIRLCKEAGLKEPEFIQEEDFKMVICRTKKATGQAENEPTGQDKGADNKEGSKSATRQVTRQAEEEVAETVKRVVLVIEDDLKRAEIQGILGLKDRETFVLNYLNPSLEAAYIEMTIPEITSHKEQRYR